MAGVAGWRGEYEPLCELYMQVNARYLVGHGWEQNLGSIPGWCIAESLLFFAKITHLVAQSTWRQLLNKSRSTDAGINMASFWRGGITAIDQSWERGSPGKYGQWQLLWATMC